MSAQPYAGLLERLEEEALALQQQAWADRSGGQSTTMSATLATEAAGAISSLLNALEELEAASSRVFDGLNARIDAAEGDSVPVFAGIAALSDALHTARAALNSDASTQTVGGE